MQFHHYLIHYQAYIVQSKQTFEGFESNAKNKTVCIHFAPICSNASPKVAFKTSSIKYRVERGIV
jgi:hypothetical protein